jgi:hypothetical protein
MRTSTAFVLLAAVGIIACGGDGPSITDNTGTGNKPADRTATVNELLGEITASQNAISRGSSAGAASDRIPTSGANLSARAAAGSGVAAAGALFDNVPTDNAALCVLDSTAVMWHCPTAISPVGDTVNVSFQFLDTLNTPQFNFDPASTAAIRRISDSHTKNTSPLQTVNGPVPAVQVDTQHQDVVLGGILSGNHAQNGTGSIIHMIAVDGRDTAFITAPTTVTGILTSPTVPYPIGGSYTAVVHTVQGKSTSTTTQVTSFDGTSTAKLVITFAMGGAPRVCTYDMTSPAPATCTGGPPGPP